MMGRASKVIILCEDKQHAVFVMRFLKKRYGYDTRACRVLPFPSGGGAGEQFVRERYAKELKAYRQRSSSAKTVLVVVIDADADSVENRVGQLERSCRDQSIEPRQSGELVVHVIPKRNIGTWLAWLDGQEANEDDDYPRYKFRKQSDGNPMTDRLVEMCQSQPAIALKMPSSMTAVCRDFARISDRLP